MRLTLSEEQELLVESARRFVERSCPTSVVRRIEGSETGHDPKLWADVSSLGWPGLVLPAEHGGSAQGMLELALLAEELGRGPYPSPLLSSTISVALPLSSASSAEQQEGLLPGLADGALIGALALVEPGARDEWAEVRVVARRAGDGWRLSGTKILVPFAAVADIFLVAADLDGAGLSLVVVDAGSPGVGVERHASLGGDPLYAVSFDGVTIEPRSVVSTGVATRELIDRALDRAAVAEAAYAVGLAARALELSVRHACEREQFGRPIGSFQAVAHRCADMRSDLDAARLLTLQAAWALDQGPADLEVGSAKAYANEALRAIFMHAHQVHGAIGFSLEHDLQLYTRRAKAFELSFGGTDRHRDRVFEHMEASSTWTIGAHSGRRWDRAAPGRAGPPGPPSRTSRPPAGSD